MRNNTNNDLTNDPKVLRIIEAARNRDKNTLKNLSIYFYGSKGMHAIKTLAHNREIETVNFLAPYAKRNNIAQGIAMSGNADFTLEWIKKGASVHRALEGAAAGGHKELVALLLERPWANIYFYYVIERAAAGEQKELTDWLIREYGVSPTEVLNTALDQYGKLSRDYNFAVHIISTYKVLPKKIDLSNRILLEMYFKNRCNIYLFLSGITDNQLRDRYINHIASTTSTAYVELFKDMKYFFRFMNEHGLSANDAYIFVRHASRLTKCFSQCMTGTGCSINCALRSSAKS
ncbi:hypothetical protein H1Q59_07800 [Holosporaceae bacterium 'Namur']|nr:hypothetical protein [Holosporaceae bacterium 'Namur']